jgi:flagellar motor switch protein FliM
VKRTMTQAKPGLAEAGRNHPLKRAQQASRTISRLVFGPGAGPSPEQLGVLGTLNTAFARKFAEWASAYLETTVEVVPSFCEQMLFAELEPRIGQQDYLATVIVEPIQSMGFFEIDIALAFSMIDLLLGGQGTGEVPERNLTEIESLTIQSVVDVILEELATAWASLIKVRFQFDRRQLRVLVVTFEIQIAERKGNLTFVFPPAVAAMLLRAISEQSREEHRPAPGERIADRRHRLESCDFTLEMCLPEQPVPAQDLLFLKPGQTLLLGYPTDKPAVMVVDGREIFTAYPVQVGGSRGALIDQRVAALVLEETSGGQRS